MADRAYEAFVAYTEKLGQEEVDESVEKLKGVLDKNGVKDVEVEPWGKKRLAYEIKDNSNAHYVILKFTAPGGAVAELERALRLEKGVIRFHTFHDTGDPETVRFHFKHYEKLASFITDRGKIRPARTTKLNAADQRLLGRQIKRARMLGLLPFTTSGQ